MAFSWSTIQKPLVALAPMSGVSDIAMRSIARRWGSDITFSEFISTDAIHFRVGQYLQIAHPKTIHLDEADILRCAEDDEFWAEDKSMMLAKFILEERPFIIQVFGNEPEHFRTAVTILNKRFGPDGFDINFGCPARSVVNNGAGSCLFLQPALAKQIITVVKETSGNIPTSIKLRASYKHVSAMEFLTAIDGAPFENVTVHMRSYEQVHTGPVNWDVGKQLKHYLAPKNISLIINGGIDSGTKAKEALEFTGADGVMVAQASLGNPFIFAEIKSALKGDNNFSVSLSEKINTVLDHASLMLEHKQNHGIIEMRKHLVWYFKGFPNAAELRKELTKVETLPQLQKALAVLHQPAPVITNIQTGYEHHISIKIRPR